MIVRFDQPGFLLLTLLAIPLIWVGWRATGGMDRTRRLASMGLRTAVLGVLSVVLAGPHQVREHDQLTVIGLLDVSGSVRRFANLPQDPELGRRSTVEYLRQWFRDAVDSRHPNDRFGLIAFDGQAIAVAVPTSADHYVDDLPTVTYLEGTNIEDAIRLGIAMFPADTAKRLVLVTDGNETSGNAAEAAGLAAGSVGADFETLATNGFGVPIDVLPIAYRAIGDVQLVRVESPSNAQPGQTVVIRMVLEATVETPGRLSLLREGVPVDLNGDAPGLSRTVTLPKGQSVEMAQVELGETPVNRFEAVFEPLGDAVDAVPDNNRAEAFTATPGKGSILVISLQPNPEATGIVAALADADLPVKATSPLDFPRDLLSLQAYDLVILDDVAAYDLDTQQHDLLQRYVNDLGGGLVMVGGDRSFGAGGWNGTTVEEILPLELDPPVELVRPAAALMILIDKSGSMNDSVAGARATQQEVANEAAALAIESLRSDSLVGVVAFDSGAHEVVTLQRNTDPDRIAEQIRSIRADGGTNLRPALVKAFQRLKNLDVDRKRIVCLSDGKSADTDLERIVETMAADGIRVTTIAIGNDADREMLIRIAEIGEGDFHDVRNPKVLPRVLVDSVQVLNKPLIKEVPFTPVVLPTGSTLTMGMESSPLLGGLVVTAPKPEPHVIVEMTHADGEPLLAHWQVGLGRAAAFTSDSGRVWTREWANWPEASAFWTQLARTIARPTSNRDAELIVNIDGDRLELVYEATDDEDGFLDYLLVEGAIYEPDGGTIPVRLRQTAPGRYEASAPATKVGNYIVALNPRRGSQYMSPSIGGVSRTSSPEFRRYQSNLGLIEQIKTLTGGRTLEISNPRAVDLYDRAGMAGSRSILPAWMTFLWMAMGVLLLDVASRRIAWSASGIRRATAAAVRRVTISRRHGERATATLSSLRQVSEAVDERLDAQAEGFTKLEGSGEIKPPPPRRMDPTPKPASVRSALNALRHRADPKPEKDAPDATEASGETPAPEPPPNPGSTDTTSSLLAAKRRARKRLNEGE